MALLLPLPLAVSRPWVFRPGPVFDLPTGGATLRWYGVIGGLDEFWPALDHSAE